MSASSLKQGNGNTTKEPSSKLLTVPGKNSLGNLSPGKI